MIIYFGGDIMEENKKPVGIRQSIPAPAEFTEPEVLFKNLVNRINSYHPSSDVTMVEKAYRLADGAHKEQKRKSGEPYIVHPLCVANILAELELDKESIVAGLLHDVVEDTHYTLEDIEEMFSEEVALLVDGVTKLTKINYAMDKVELQAENLRKMFLAMAKDIRVILIKLADRLHNMRTLQYQQEEKQKEIARETMDIYAPIAQRLGISKIKVELDDLSLKYLKPDVYKDLAEKIATKRSERQAYIDNIVAEVEEHMKEADVETKVEGRIKHFFSIYKKMINQNKTLDEIYDLFAVRIIVNSLKDCYAALGIIHEMYKPVPGRFKDYIAMPKPNMYQSLHTTLIGPNGAPFEIQIRTFEMHRTAEYGIAAHWRYKEGNDGKGTSASSEEEKLTWLRQVLEWQRDLSDNKEFLSLLKDDFNLFSDSVYTFTPTGDVKTLPNGSNTIDFAYNIHSAVGNKMVGARVNGKLVPIDYVLQNGDRVEIMTSQNSKGPSRDWLSVVKSTQAKNKINQWFRSHFKEENIMKGKELLSDYAKSRNIVLSDLLKNEYIDGVKRKYGFRDWDSVLAAIGHGGLKEGQVVNKLKDEYRKKNKKEITDDKIMESIGISKEERTPSRKSKGGIVVEGIHDVSVRLSKCCSPVPGDEIIGFVTRGRGVSIHRTDCINVLNLPESDRERLIDAEWSITDGKETGGLYVAEIVIYSHNRTGVLVDISKVFTENKIDVTSMNVRTNKKGRATIVVGFEISSVEELNEIVSKIRNVESVIDIERTAG